MARTITTMARSAPISTVVEVPEDVAQDLQDGLKFLQENPTQVLVGGWDDESGKEKELFMKQAKAWATQNELVYATITSKNMGPTGLRFWIGTQEQRDKDLEAVRASNARKEAGEPSRKPGRKPTSEFSDA